jgi:hypothetical protein
MGWHYKQAVNGEKAIDTIRREVIGAGVPCEIVAAAVYLREAYLAIRDDRTGVVSAVVVLIDRRAGEIGFKVIDEEMGPFYYRAPARVLDALTPTANETAQGWRVACRTAAERRRALSGEISGRRVSLWGKVYTIERRAGGKSRAWLVTEERSGALFRLKPGQLAHAVPL